MHIERGKEINTHNSRCQIAWKVCVSEWQKFKIYDPTHCKWRRKQTQSKCSLTNDAFPKPNKHTYSGWQFLQIFLLILSYVGPILSRHSSKITTDNPLIWKWNIKCQKQNPVFLLFLYFVDFLSLYNGRLLQIVLLKIRQMPLHVMAKPVPELMTHFNVNKRLALIIQSARFSVRLESIELAWLNSSIELFRKSTAQCPSLSLCSTYHNAIAK